MSNAWGEHTICGVKIDAFAMDPTPEELAAIVARWSSKSQALFIILLGEQLGFALGVDHYRARVADIWRDIGTQEEEASSSYGSDLIRDLRGDVS